MNINKDVGSSREINVLAWVLFQEQKSAYGLWLLLSGSAWFIFRGIYLPLFFFLRKALKEFLLSKIRPRLI